MFGFCLLKGFADMNKSIENTVTQIKDRHLQKYIENLGQFFSKAYSHLSNLRYHFQNPLHSQQNRDLGGPNGVIFH